MVDSWDIKDLTLLSYVPMHFKQQSLVSLHLLCVFWLQITLTTTIPFLRRRFVGWHLRLIRLQPAEHLDIIVVLDQRLCLRHDWLYWSLTTRAFRAVFFDVCNPNYTSLGDELYGRRQKGEDGKRNCFREGRSFVRRPVMIGRSRFALDNTVLGIIPGTKYRYQG